MRRGFTLIELSIVLVIIGLIAGGILVGSDLIRAAELRSLLTDVEKIQTATNTFRLKYSHLPGDMPDAETLWDSDASCPLTPPNLTPKSQTCNGNGNGKVDYVGWATCGDSPVEYQTEAYRFWQHLANANLWAGNFSGTNTMGGVRNGRIGINVPAASKLSDVGYQLMNFEGVLPAGGVGGAANWFQDNYHNILFIGGENRDGCWEPLQPFLSATEAKSVDDKVDDGKPGAGNWRTYTPTYHPGCADSDVPATANYVPGGTNVSCAFIHIVSWF